MAYFLQNIDIEAQKGKHLRHLKYVENFAWIVIFTGYCIIIYALGQLYYDSLAENIYKNVNGTSTLG